MSKREASSNNGKGNATSIQSKRPRHTGGDNEDEEDIWDAEAEIDGEVDRLSAGSHVLDKSLCAQDECQEVPAEFLEGEEQEEELCDPSKWMRPSLERDVDSSADNLGAISARAYRNYDTVLQCSSNFTLISILVSPWQVSTHAPTPTTHSPSVASEVCQAAQWVQCLFCGCMV